MKKSNKLKVVKIQELNPIGQDQTIYDFSKSGSYQKKHGSLLSLITSTSFGPCYLLLFKRTRLLNPLRRQESDYLSVKHHDFNEKVELA